MNICRFSLFPILVIAVISIAPSCIVFSQARQPILQIETGMHTAGIRHIAVDAANRWLITASDDKTARVWDLKTGELLRVLRVPIGADNEGKLFAVAISPDGNTIAVGGWTTNELDDFESIYLFDRNNGRVVHRISNFTTVVDYLDFSPDGRFLVAAVGKGEGVRIYDTSNYQQIGAGADYDDKSYGVDFDQNSRRLVTTCLDGFVRLYTIDERGLKLAAKKKARNNKLPYSVKFSPDGTKVAVGFGDSTTVSVLSAKDLTLSFTPDTSNIDNGDLRNVAWSADGSKIYAGGRYDIRGNCPIRYWSKGGQGGYEDILVGDDTVSDIQPLSAGGIIYSAGGVWGILDATGKRTQFVETPIADYRAMLSNFLLSKDSSEFVFGYVYGGDSPARFSILDRRLKIAENNANGSLNQPRITGIDVTDWLDSYEPKLNGVKLPLKNYEASFGFAVAPDNSKFALGTNFRIILFNRNGKDLWSIPASESTWGVNISGDGRLVVAALGDGTIRWYRVSDGKELLAFFPHSDRKRWILWTPSGYYDASPDAEELIGWHINDGKDAAANFFPVSRFRDVYYRPDVIDRVLKDLDETVAVNKANEAANRRQQETDIAKRLPPVVTILSPQKGSEVSVNKVKIRYEVRTPSGEPVTGYKVLIDGRPATIERGVGVKVVGANVGELSVTIPEKDCEISLIAENKYASSVASSVGLKWKGKVSTVAKKPRLLVLAVGVSKYQMADLNLGYAAKDANDFVSAMSRQKPAMYSEVVVKLLTDEQATRNAVVDGLDWINVNTNAEDVAMVFFAGHGDNDNLNRYYFLPHNFNPQSASTKVTFNDIKSVVETIKGKALFFIDTCRSGNVLGKSLGRNLTGFANELSSAENGVIVFTASTGTQVSLEDATWENGAFTKALVEGINGKADLFQKGNVTITGLDAYISNRVKELTNQQQTPATAKPDLVSDFSIAAKF